MHPSIAGTESTYYLATGIAMKWFSHLCRLPCTGPSAALTGETMQRMLLYPPASAWPFLPAAFQLPPPNASLFMTGCTIYTLCATVRAYTTYLNVTAPSNITVRAWPRCTSVPRRY